MLAQSMQSRYLQQYIECFAHSFTNSFTYFPFTYYTSFTLLNAVSMRVNKTDEAPALMEYTV